MKTTPIDVILFDIGGTLRRTHKRSLEECRQRISQLMALLGADAPVDEFTELLVSRSKAYKTWAEETEVELTEAELWTRWMAPDFLAEKVASMAVKLNQLWRESHSQYVVRPEAKEVLLALFRQGYRLGVISNTTSSVETPQIFEDMAVSGILEVVILSCQVGRRKPNPQILLEATRRMGVDPAHCAYVGDLPKRDVRAARAAGFAEAVVISDTLKYADIPDDPTLKPDHIIRALPELVAIYPPKANRSSIHPGQPRYAASISTMWGMRNFPGLEDFFIAAQRMGFGSIELNHQVNSAMLAGIDLASYAFSSVHEPCPADVSADELKTRDWLISSLDEANRRRGVESIVRSIHLAKELGARAIVIHAGTVVGDWKDESELKALFTAGKAGTPEFAALRHRLIMNRAAAARPHIQSVKRSLLELLEVASPLGIRLGLENRYHYQEIPLLDELDELLGLAPSPELGFWYDMGHAQVMDRLGFLPHKAWLERCASRMIGVHVQDVTGIIDHGAPGFGEVDYDMVLPFIPKDAIRTFEVRPSNSPEQVRQALAFLVGKGFIQCP